MTFIRPSNRWTADASGFRMTRWRSGFLMSDAANLLPAKFWHRRRLDRERRKLDELHDWNRPGGSHVKTVVVSGDGETLAITTCL